MTTRVWTIVLVGVLLASVLASLSGCPPPAKTGTGAAAGPPGTAKGAATPGEQTTGGAAAAASMQEGVYGAKDGIPVGAYFGLTGTDATFGQDTCKAMVLALDEMEKSGWKDSKPIKVLLSDDRCNAADVPAILNKLLKDDKVVAVVGEVASARSLEGAPACQTAHVPMVSPSSTNPKVTQIGDFIFRTCFTDDYQGAGMADFAVEHFKAKTAAVLFPQHNAYSVGLATYFKKAFQAAGGSIVADSAYGQNQKDFRSELELIKGKGPDVLFVPCYYDDAGMIAKQARDLGLNMPILGGDGWDSPNVAEVAKDAAENCFFGNHYSKDDPSPLVQDFVKNYTARWGEVPSAMAATGYDVIRVVAAAIARASDPTNGTALRDAIAATRDFEGVSGKITLNKERNAEKDMVILEIRKGVQTLVTTVPAAPK